MRIVITGGAGFLGLHLALKLSNLYRIKLIDITDFNKKEFPENCIFVKGDIRDRKFICQVTKGADAIIHTAAALPLRKAEEIHDINVNGTKNLLEASVKNKIKNFIYISSTAVYGIPKRHPIYENDSLFGVGPYGQSKIEAEKLCGDYRKKGLTVTIIRPKTFVGTHRLGVFEILFDWIKDGKKIPVLGSGNNRYQLLDVDDLVDAINLFIIQKNNKNIDDTFNIGAEKYSTVKNDLQKLFDYAHSGSVILPTPALPVKKILWLFDKLHLSPLYQWIYDTADKDSFVSIDKLVVTLNWHPKYSNSEALIKAYKWYEDNYSVIKSKPAGLTHTVGWKQGILGFFKKFL